MIADFELKNLKMIVFHSKWQILEKDERKTVLTEDFELHIIEIPKIYILLGGAQC